MHGDDLGSTFSLVASCLQSKCDLVGSRASAGRAWGMLRAHVEHAHRRARGVRHEQGEHTFSWPREDLIPHHQRGVMAVVPYLWWPDAQRPFGMCSAWPVRVAIGQTAAESKQQLAGSRQPI